MSRRIRTHLTLLLSAGLTLACARAAWTDDSVPLPDESAAQQQGVFDQNAVAQQTADTQEQPKGVEVQASGPVHEAFAEPGNGNLQSNPIIAKEPPAAIARTCPRPS